MESRFLIDHWEKALVASPERRPEETRLFVSELGRNPFFMIQRLQGQAEKFDVPTLIKMDNGKAMELATVASLQERLPRPAIAQHPLFDHLWAGYADLLLPRHMGTRAMVVEIKSVGNWWDYKESLPRPADICQVWLYGQLYQEMTGEEFPDLKIFYRGWGTYAEFDLELDRDRHGVWGKGMITDKKGESEEYVERWRLVWPEWLKVEMEYHFGEWMIGDATVEDPGGPDWDFAINRTAEIIDERKEGWVTF